MSNIIANHVEKEVKSLERIVKEKYTLTPEEIAHYKSMKASYPNFPRLPKFILKNKKFQKKISKELQFSCIRGFMDRVNNWYKLELASADAKKALH